MDEKPRQEAKSPEESLRAERTRDEKTSAERASAEKTSDLRTEEEKALDLKRRAIRKKLAERRLVRIAALNEEDPYNQAAMRLLQKTPWLPMTDQLHVLTLMLWAKEEPGASLREDYGMDLEDMYHVLDFVEDPDEAMKWFLHPEEENQAPTFTAEEMEGMEPMEAAIELWTHLFDRMYHEDRLVPPGLP